jgi:hypothetical protein
MIYLVFPTHTCKASTHGMSYISFYASNKYKSRGSMQKVLWLGRRTYGLTHIESQGRSFLPFVQEPSEAKEGTWAMDINKDTTNPSNTTNIYLPGTAAVLPACQSPSSAASEGR